jgi:hypothetical protein
MLKDIVMVQHRAPYQLLLRFEDGVEGIVNLAELIEFSGIFLPLQDPSYFSQVQINPESGTIMWDNGADLDPDVLYSIVTGQPIPGYSSPSIAT